MNKKKKIKRLESMLADLEDYTIELENEIAILQEIFGRVIANETENAGDLANNLFGQ